MTTNDQRWHLMATPTVTLRHRLCDEVWALEKLGHGLGGLLADERTILNQLYTAEVTPTQINRIAAAHGGTMAKSGPVVFWQIMYALALAEAINRAPFHFNPHKLPYTHYGPKKGTRA